MNAWDVVGKNVYQQPGVMALVIVPPWWEARPRQEELGLHRG